MKNSASLKVGFKDDYYDDVSAVDARRLETVRVKKTVMMVQEEDDDDDVEVDSRAYDFIKKFKNDLKLQRIYECYEWHDFDADDDESGVEHIIWLSIIGDFA
ncbi:dual specificity protein kinase zak2-like protein [Tanacetum coccineum]